MTYVHMQHWVFEWMLAVCCCSNQEEVQLKWQRRESNGQEWKHIGLITHTDHFESETICTATAHGPLQWRSLQGKKNDRSRTKPSSLGCQRSIALQCLCIIAALQGTLRCTQKHTLMIACMEQVCAVKEKEWIACQTHTLSVSRGEHLYLCTSNSNSFFCPLLAATIARDSWSYRSNGPQNPQFTSICCTNYILYI